MITKLVFYPPQTQIVGLHRSCCNLTSAYQAQTFQTRNSFNQQVQSLKIKNIKENYVGLKSVSVQKIYQVIAKHKSVFMSFQNMQGLNIYIFG